MRYAPLILASFFLPSLAHAATLTVGPACSLPNAIASTNSNTSVGGCTAGENAVADRINLPAGTFSLSDAGGDGTAFDLFGPVEIAGAGIGVTTIDGGATDRLFNVFTFGIIIRDLTIADGLAAPTGVGDGGNGGAVLVLGSVTVKRVEFLGNSAGNGGDGSAGGDGGAIRVENDGRANVVDCSFRENTAGEPGSGSAVFGEGGAISAGPAARLVIVSSTFSFNGVVDPTAVAGAVFASGAEVEVVGSHFEGNRGSGGALMCSGGSTLIEGSSFIGNNDVAVSVEDNGALTVRNSTFQGNYVGIRFASTTAKAALTNLTVVLNSYGVSTLLTGSGALDIRNSIVAGSAFGDCFGSPVTTSNTIASSCVADYAILPSELFTRVLSDTPVVAETTYYPLLANSIAQNAATCSGGDELPVLLDQRGVPRPALRCDIGAYEVRDDGIVITDEPSGANCPHGGKKVDVVADEDGDGVAVILDTEYVCNGAPGADANNGADGAVGPAGPQGPAGARGDDGSAGESGGCASTTPDLSLALGALALLLSGARKRACSGARGDLG